MKDLNWDKSSNRFLTSRANKDWKIKHGETAWYTPSYKAKTPSMWAKQYLSINMINAIGRHIERGIGKSLYQTKNASILKTAGTRQDYISHRFTPQTNNGTPPPHQHHNQLRHTPSPTYRTQPHNSTSEAQTTQNRSRHTSPQPHIRSIPFRE